MNEDSPVAPSSPNENPAVDTSSGEQQHAHTDVPGNTSSGINWPEKDHAFWNWPDELKVQWLLSREAEARFDTGVGHHVEQMNDGYSSPYPESITQAISQLAWGMLLQNQKAYGQLRNATTEEEAEVIEHYFKQASAYIRKLSEEHRDYKPAPPIDKLHDDIANPKIPLARTLTRLRASAEPKVGEFYADRKKFFDEDLPAIFGRR